MSIYYLMVNRNGFEEPILEGTKERLEIERARLEKVGNTLTAENASPDVKIQYYIVPKEDRDLEHCPLMPVDYS